MKNLLDPRTLCLGFLVFASGCSLGSAQPIQYVGVTTNIITNIPSDILTNVVTNVITNVIVVDSPQTKFLSTLQGKNIIVKDELGIYSSGTFSSDGKTLMPNAYSSYTTSGGVKGNSGSFASFIVSNATSPYPFQSVADSEGLVGSYRSELVQTVSTSTMTRTEVTTIITLNAARSGGTIATTQYFYSYHNGSLTSGYPTSFIRTATFTLSDSPVVSN